SQCRAKRIRQAAICPHQPDLCDAEQPDYFSSGRGPFAPGRNGSQPAICPRKEHIRRCRRARSGTACLSRGDWELPETHRRRAIARIETNDLPPEKPIRVVPFLGLVEIEPFQPAAFLVEVADR